jgi:hypothetical protein
MFPERMLGLAIVASLIAANGSGNMTATANDPPSKQSSIQEAEKLAGTFRRIIESGDEGALLELIDDDGLRCVDEHTKIAALRKGFAARRGLYYGMLFDTPAYREWWTEELKARVVPDLLSYRDFFRTHPEVQVEAGAFPDGLKGAFAWKLAKESVEIHSPIFEWRWDAKRKKALIFSIGCWLG